MVRAARSLPAPPRRNRSRPRVAALLLATGLLASLCGPAAALDPARDAVRIRDDPDFGRMKRTRLMLEARAERRERLGGAAEVRRARRRRAVAPGPPRAPRGRGARMKPLPPRSEALPGPVPAPPAARAGASIPPNVLVNDKTGDGPTATQAEESATLWGNFGLCAWNNGQGFLSGQDTQGAGWTADGGATWTRVAIPHPPGAVANYWYTDPVVTLNEKTGEFWYAAISRPNGVAVAPATFPGGRFTWGTPREVRQDASGALLFDKPWIAADSLTGNLYLTYTTFGAVEDTILFQRSTDHGATWSEPIAINLTPQSIGGVQGSRPAVGEGGEVYVVWQELGLVDADTMKTRVSHDHGASFAPENVVAAEFSNAGSGAPGYNRPNGFTFPAIAVDRTPGAWRGRVYVAWHEAVNFYDDPLGGGGARSEVEDNGTFATATPFTPGMKLRGDFTAADLDLWGFDATRGTTYIFFCDSTAPSLNYEMRILCSDQATRLAYGATDPNFPGQKITLCWTAPADGRYVLRTRVTGGGGGYRIQTGTDTPQPGEHARDQRDAIVAWSQHGTPPWTAVRINDDDPWLDDWMPEVAVAADGNVYALWYDWRDALADCAGSSHMYASRSTDGGATWVPAVRVTSTATHWTSTIANISPNQGDYVSLAGSGRLLAAWSDGRLVDIDVFAALVPVDLQLAACAADVRAAAGSTVPAAWTLVNGNPLFANTWTLTLTNTLGWPVPPGGEVTAQAGGSAAAHLDLPVPASAVPGAVNTFCATFQNAAGASRARCCFTLTVAGEVATLQLLGAVPNPPGRELRVRLALAPGPAKLELFDLAGRRVLGRDLVGPTPLPWADVDLTSQAAGLRSGVYTLRLSQAGRSLDSRIALIR